MYMFFYLFLAIIGGTCIGLHAGINGVLGKRIGVIEDTFLLVGIFSRFVSD